jgi:ribosome-associated protein
MIGPGAMLGGVLEDVRVNDRLIIPAAGLVWCSSRAGRCGSQRAGTTDARVITWPTY